MNKQTIRKGLILAGGNGSRLYPLTKVVNKQLLPVYDKPMIHYPLSTLMLAGIKDIMIITTPLYKRIFESLLGNGTSLGIKLTYEVQPEPKGLADTFLIAEDFIDSHPVCMILGDNIFHGSELVKKLEKANFDYHSNTIFIYPVQDPSRYGVASFNQEGKIINIEEKPKNPKSKYAVTGIYFFDSTVVEKAKKVKASKRDELEISCILSMYIQEKKLITDKLGRGTAWFDTGTFDSLHQASSFIRTLELRQGMKIGCPEEVAWRKGWVNANDLKNIAAELNFEYYGRYLNDIIENEISN